MTQIARLFLLATIVLGVCSTTFADEKRIRMEHRLTTDTCLLIAANNVADLKERLKICSLGRLMNDPSLKQAKDHAVKLFNDEIKDLDLPDGVTLDDFLAIPSGEAVFALMKPTGSDVPFVLSVDFGDSKAVVDKIIAAFETEAEAGQEYEKTSHAGVVLHVFHDRSDDVDPKSKTSQAIAVFVADRTFVATNLVSLSQTLIDNWNGAKENSLANNEAFQYIRLMSQHDQKTPSLFWYFDFNQTINGLLEGSTDFAANLVRGNLPAMGLAEFRAIGGSLEVSTQKYDLINRTVGYIVQPTTGLLNVFRFPEAKIALPEWVPKGAIGVGTMNWDTEFAYTASRELANALIGRGNFDKAVQKLATDPTGPRVHIKRDVIDQLTGKLYVVQTAMVIVDDEPQEGPTLLAGELKELVQAKQILSRLLDNNDDFTARDFGGSRIYTSKDEDLALSITIAHGCVMISDGPELLEATISIDAANSGVLASKRLQRHIQELPRNASMISIQESSPQFAVLYDYLAKMIIPNAAGFGKLPDFANLRHYFLPTAGYVLPTEKGFIHTSFSLQQKIGD
jgi:hypothetical protein